MKDAIILTMYGTVLIALSVLAAIHGNEIKELKKSAEAHTLCCLASGINK